MVSRLKAEGEFGEAVASTDRRRRPGAAGPYVVKRLRESHHRIARLFALGMRGFEVAELTGYTAVRVNQLRQTKPMQELIAYYVREHVNPEYEKEVNGYYQNAVKARDIAMRQILDQLESADETGEYLPTRALAAVHGDLADRTGYGKRSTQVNVNVDFAAQLDRAIARSRGEGVASPKTIDLLPTSPVNGHTTRLPSREKRPPPSPASLITRRV